MAAILAFIPGAPIPPRKPPLPALEKGQKRDPVTQTAKELANADVHEPCAATRVGTPHFSVKSMESGDPVPDVCL